MGVLLLADRRFETDRLLRDLENVAHLLHGDVHLRGDLLGARVVAQLLQQLAGNADDLVDRLDHMHRNADRARLVGDGAGDGLTDPPRRVGREFVALGIVKLFDGLDEAEIALLNEIEEQHAAADVAFGDAHDETEVCLRHAALGLLVALRHAHGELDLFLLREQADLADLLEIHAHGVVGRVGIHHAVGFGDLFFGDLIDLLELVECGKELVIVDGRQILADGLDVQLFERIVKPVHLLLREIQPVDDVRDLLERQLSGLLAFFDQVGQALLAGFLRVLRLFLLAARAVGGLKLVILGNVRDLFRLVGRENGVGQRRKSLSLADGRGFGQLRLR